MARTAWGSLKINGGAIAPVNNGFIPRHVVRTISAIRQTLASLSSVKQRLSSVR